MISYAQNFEDVVLARVFRDTPAGFYVDVGANDPDHHSVTRHFSDAGWRGINVEPGLIFSALAARRPRDVNLNVAASDRAGAVTFYEFPAAAGLAGLSPDVPPAADPGCGRGRFARTVPAVPLRDILAAHAPGPIDFLSVDVEGHERQVLVGNDWARFRPRVVVVEATLPLSPVPCHDRWEDVLTGAGYLFAYFDGLNRFYVRREDAGLAPRFGPPSVFDGFVPAAEAGLRQQVGVLARTCDSLADQLAARDAQVAGIGARSLAAGLWVGRALTRVRGLARPRAFRVPVPRPVVRFWTVPGGPGGPAASPDLRAAGVDVPAAADTI